MEGGSVTAPVEGMCVCAYVCMCVCVYVGVWVCGYEGMRV
jgi:hypothetical protein